jgi:phage shock protein PspC (stress-responsive transcriptional regulator)
MVVENEQHFQFAEFDESSSLPLVDDRSVDLESFTQADQDGANLLTFTGLITAVSGLAMFLASNLEAGPQSLRSVMFGAGLVAMGIGIGRVLMKLIKPRGISLPPIKLKRKTENKRSGFGFSNSGNFGSFQDKQGGLRKSNTDTIFAGICGGIAESSGVSSTVVRAIFIAAFAVTGGAAFLIYIVLFFMMRNDGETNIRKNTNRN